MEHSGGTTSLRSVAPQWSLAGDKKLLQLLQNIHEKVVTKCKETNSLLDQMVTSLDDACIEVQTVNNRFMSLSNSQFVERRVYSDDADVTNEPLPDKSVPQPTTPRSELARIKSSLRVLESHHEMVEILPETDSDSDDDELTRVVFKPKNVYADRPLPHIIGSQNWRKKWHAGTLPSDSDTSESCSRQSEYSESDHDVMQSQWPNNDDTLSSVSSEVISPLVQPAPAPVTNMTPAQIANELARRLGNVPQTATEYEKPQMDATRINKPDAPLTANIFSEEPPPISQSLTDAESEEENDIFAELHKSKIYEPARNNYKDIFENSSGSQNDRNQVNDKLTSKRKQVMEREDSKSESSATKPRTDLAENVDNALKKPIGAISMFGSNKGTESIGAAILKRHQQSLSSDEDSESEKPQIQRKPKPAKTFEKEKTKKPEKDIFEDLFAKSHKPAKNDAIKTKEQTRTTKPANKKVDLFNDNIFDDIDDIFTSNIASAPKNEVKNQKSIFEDDDELFSEVAVIKPTEGIDMISGGSKNDSADQLFSENVEKTTVNISKKDDKIKNDDQKSPLKITKPQQKESKSIFDDSSDDDLFANIEIRMPPKPTQSKNITLDIEKVLSPEINSFSIVKSVDQDVEKESKPNEDVIKAEQVLSVSKDQPKTKLPFQSPSLFDDGDDDLFLSSQQKQSQIDYDDESKSSTQTAHNVVETVSQTSVVNNASVGDSQNADENFMKNKSEGLEDTAKYSDSDSNGSYKISFVKDDSVTPKEISVNKNDLLDSVVDYDEQKSKDRDIHHKRKLELEKSLEETLFAKSISEVKPVGDIFADEPPLFEKPKEPKKSKNINALFDDDSDDEALFFKKDPTLDENPEDFEPPTPIRFGIFHDEPPDLDVDFAQKTEVVTKNTDTLKESLSYSVPPNVQAPKSEVDKEKTNEGVQSKKVGKLKPMSLNIDVNTLLPGASPKKTQKQPAMSESANLLSDTSDKSDEINITTNEINKTPDLPYPPIAEPEIVEVTETDGLVTSKDLPSIPKSVSFEGDPESNVLDNKLSKERARIQVKRRPSSRRARHEAVRKSIRENRSESCDSTDNSSSIDDHKSTETSKQNDDVSSNLLYSTDKQGSTSHNIDVKDESKENLPKSDADLTNFINTDSQIVTDAEGTEIRQKDVKSKVVYVLNDEDIFTNTETKLDSNALKSNNNLDKQTEVQNKSETSEGKSKTLTIIDDDDSMFKPAFNKTQAETKPTNANITSTKAFKTKLFEDSSDDETLFKPKTQPSKKPTNLFGSDSDDDIFSGKKKETKDAVVEEGKRGKVVKKNLFSDDEDDEDLFGARNKTGSKIIPIKATSPTPSLANDPLSNQDNIF